MKHDARKYCHIKGPLNLKNGGVLESPIIAFETWGTLNDSKDNGVLIFTGLSPSAHAASSKNDPSKGWWEKMIGPNKPIDTERYFVICANSLGSCFGSTGPASIDPITNKTFGLTLGFKVVESGPLVRSSYMADKQVKLMHEKTI